MSQTSPEQTKVKETSKKQVLQRANSPVDPFAPPTERGDRLPIKRKPIVVNKPRIDREKTRNSVEDKPSMRKSVNSPSVIDRKRQRIKLGTQANEVLAIITDQRNGKEYYVAMMDSFIYDSREYSVMYNYEPDSAEHIDPEIVIMRTYRDTEGNQFFTSVRNRNEMNIVFEIFYERYMRSLKK